MFHKHKVEYEVVVFLQSGGLSE